MKTLLASTAIALLAATVAQGSAFTDSIVKQLTDQGYTRIEVTVGPNQVKAEAIKGASQREMIFDRSSGAVLKDSTDAVSAGDDTSPGVDVSSSSEDFVKDGSSDDSGDDNGSDDTNDDSGDDNGSDDGDSGDDNGSDDGDSGGDSDN